MAQHWSSPESVVVPVRARYDHRRRWFRRASPAERVVADDCEAYVDGRYLELLLLHGQLPPRWAWTNVLAHGAPEDLARVAEEATVPRPLAGVASWWEARAYLAGEVLLVADHHVPFGIVQARAMRPLEQEVAGFGLRRWYQAGDWAQDALTALAPLRAWRPSRLLVPR